MCSLVCTQVLWRVVLTYAFARVFIAEKVHFPTTLCSLQRCFMHILSVFLWSNSFPRFPHSLLAVCAGFLRAAPVFSASVGWGLLLSSVPLQFPSFPGITSKNFIKVQSHWFWKSMYSITNRAVPFFSCGVCPGNPEPGAPAVSGARRIV